MFDSGQSSQSELTDIFNWLDSCEAEDWIPMIWGIEGDAKSSCIIQVQLWQSGIRAW